MLGVICMSLSLLEKKRIILEFGINEKNTGSIEAQIALLTTQINNLQYHFSNNLKDHSSRRGLLNMVSHRRKLLNYLKKTYFASYGNLIKKLALRR